MAKKKARDLAAEIDAVLRAEHVRQVILADKDLMEMLDRSLAALAAGERGTPLDELPRPGDRPTDRQ